MDMSSDFQELSHIDKTVFIICMGVLTILLLTSLLVVAFCVRRHQMRILPQVSCFHFYFLNLFLIFQAAIDRTTAWHTEVNDDDFELANHVPTEVSSK
jgi:hypothetical protein